MWAKKNDSFNYADLLFTPCHVISNTLVEGCFDQFPSGLTRTVLNHYDKVAVDFLLPRQSEVPPDTNRTTFSSS